MIRLHRANHCARGHERQFGVDSTQPFPNFESIRKKTTNSPTKILDERNIQRIFWWQRKKIHGQKEPAPTERYGIVIDFVLNG